jgi:hypothetical protein
LILGLCTAACAVEFAGGTGEPNHPYLIATPQQLVALGSDPNLWAKHFALVHDLDMTGMDPNVVGPIGIATKPFVGVFDGKGHTISNLRMVRRFEFEFGLFGCIGERMAISRRLDRGVGHVRDLHLKEVNVQCYGNVGGLAGVLSGGTVRTCSVSGVVRGAGPMSGSGGLIGCVEEGQVTSCSAVVDVHGEASVGGLIGEMVGADIACCTSSGRVQGGSRAGGLIGVVQFWEYPVGVHESKPREPINPGSVLRCRSDCSVIEGETAGGLIGHVFGTGKVEDCYALGPTYGKEAAGGLIGERWESCVIRCYSAGQVVSGENAGGFIGSSECNVDANTPSGCPPCRLVVERVVPSDSPSGETVKGPQWRVAFRPAVMSCFWNAGASGATKGFGSGADTQGGVNSLTTAQMRTAEAFRNFGWDCENVWTICEGKDYPRLRWEGQKK